MRALPVLATIAVVIALALSSPASKATPAPAGNPPSTDFSCAGPVHAQAIQFWEQTAKPYFTQQIQNNLNQQGDVYVLYNTQEELQSFVEMTRRCKDRQQIAELAETLSPVFTSLRPLPDAPATRGWVCTGGQTCTSANHLLGKEVQLCSAQFLGLLGALATDIVETIPASQQTATEKTFVANAADAMATQLDHWLSPDYFKWVADRANMTPADVKDGQSKYFFADRDLWFMTTLSDLSELHEANVDISAPGAQAVKSLQSKSPQIAGMFNLFLQRTALISTPSSTRATIDRGFWRNYADNKYAAYDASTSPVLCQKNHLNQMVKTLRVEAKASYIDPDMGWDISHARRLVPALDTFARNKANLSKVFGYTNEHFDPHALQKAFANQIIEKIWNKDPVYPLFSNYWDGSNGWYRSGYDNGTGRCVAGDPPYSLGWSIPTGGYLQWGAFNDKLRNLGSQIYRLLRNNDARSKSFVDEHYSQMDNYGPSASLSQKVWALSFISGIVDID